MSQDLGPYLSALLDSLDGETAQMTLDISRTLQSTDRQAGPFPQLLGIQFTEFAQGRCTATLDVRAYMLNRLGVAHGGVTFSLADTVCGGAALSALGVPRLVTQDLQIRYHAPVRLGLLTASAEVLHHGKRTITTLGRVTQDEVLVASASGTFAILSDAEIARLA